MDFVQLLILGLVQGITEFLPISSSAHLILLPDIMGWQDQGLVNDIAAHVGSLVAVTVYFRGDIHNILRPWLVKQSTGANPDRRLLPYILFATLPIMIAGLLFYEVIAVYMRDPVIIALASIFFGLVLWWADSAGKQSRTMEELSVKDALWVGLAQVLALVPGTSRSGITMTAGLMLGMDRQAAARFSFLLAIPAITMAGGHEGWRYFMENSNTDWVTFFTVAVIAGISAWITIHYFLKFLARTGMLPYVVYRVVLGVALLVAFL